MEKCSIIIPLAANGFGSRWNDTELKYCFRSIEKHLTGYGDIFLVGHCPKWVKNVIHIPATDGDKTWDKERNIFNKIMLACNDERVTDDFLFMNDDHFLLKDYVAGEFPYYCNGYLSDYVTREDQYGNTIRNTKDYLSTVLDHDFHQYKTNSFYFDVHCPMRFNKGWFEYLQSPDWSKKYGYCIKSAYCELNDITGIEYPDLKINEAIPSQKIKELIAGRHWFSMGNRAREGGMGKVLEELYPKKSLYEK